MQAIEFSKWKILSDPDLTREVYAQIETGGAELCGCEACFNFATARHLIYSAEVIDLLDCFGIDPLLESCVRHRAQLEPGLHRYSGWFHLVGEIAWGPPTVVAASGSDAEPIASLISTDAELALGFSADRSRAPEPFYGLPTVELEFAARIPWISNAPEPV